MYAFSVCFAIRRSTLTAHIVAKTLTVLSCSYQCVLLHGVELYNKIQRAAGLYLTGSEVAAYMSSLNRCGKACDG